MINAKHTKISQSIYSFFIYKCKNATSLQKNFKCLKKIKDQAPSVWLLHQSPQRLPLLALEGPWFLSVFSHWEGRKGKEWNTPFL